MGNSFNEEDIEHSLSQSQFFHYVDSISHTTIKEKNGDKYIGEMKNNKKEGRGILIYSNKNEKYIKYEGFWKQDKKNNKGTMYYKDGSTYIGHWKNDMRDGKGELYYSTGEIYNGTFKEDKKEGEGYFYSKNYNSIFYGNYKNDVKDGKGITFYIKNNKISNEFWENGVIIKCKIEKRKNNLNYSNILNKNESEIFSFFPNNENKNKINSLNLIKYYKASIPNNFFDIMNLVIMTYTLLYDNGDINEWKENTIIKLFEKIGIEKNKYNEIILNNQITGTKFLKLNFNDLKEYKITDVRDIKIIMKSINFLREFYIRYFDYYKEYEKEEEAKLPTQMKTSIKKNISNFIGKRASSKIFTFAKEKMDSTDSISKLNKITEKDLALNDSNDSQNILENDDFKNDTSDNYEELSPKKSEDKIEIKRRDKKSITIKLSRKNKKKEIIENVGFTLIKMSITNLFIQSLFQNGFDFYIPFDELQLEEEIEHDDIYFQLFMGKWQGKQVVIKLVSTERIKNEIKNNKKYSKLSISDVMQNFIKEINICNNLRHPNVILFIGVSINKNDFYIVFEYLENHSLYEILHKRNSDKKLLTSKSKETKEDKLDNIINEEKIENKEIKDENKEENQKEKDNLNISINNINMNDDNEAENMPLKNEQDPYDKFHDLDEVTQKKILFQIAYEISVALRYIHSRNIIHCNLKTNYLFLDEEYHVKLGNFFYSKIINFFSDENKEEEYFIENENEWTPPEILTNEKFEESSDVYRLGLILYEIFTGEIPHKSMGSNQIIGLNYIVSEEDIMSKALVNLIQKCVSKNPKNRPNLEFISNFLYKYSDFYDKREFSFEEIGNFLLA